MDEQLTISTPEQVAFHYEVAGIGTRFVASLVDHLIIGTMLTLIWCAFLMMVPAVGVGLGIYSSDGATAAIYLILALLVLITFLVLWGYFIFFEMAWAGQTPGKRLVRLRVIRRDGQPVRTGEIIVRNLVRLVDLLPGFYAIGLISMFIDKQARRLGDFAAGTLVVKEGAETSLRDVRVPVPALASGEAWSPSGGSGGQYPGHYAAYDPLPGVSLRGLAPDDYRLIRELLTRLQRGELAGERGQELAYRLATGVATRMGHNFADWQARGWHPLTFLDCVLKAKEARGE
jgi:uncharacterized RDD family membrane protein YckC